VGVGGSRARRLSLGAAVTFAVAAVAGVAGNRLTGQVTPALGAFAGLVVAGMLLTYWLDRSARSSGSSDGDGGGPCPQVSDLGGVQQNVIASAPGATAQGALAGNVINYGNVARPSPGAPTPSQSSEDGSCDSG
jgi:hypothetical protein